MAVFAGFVEALHTPLQEYMSGGTLKDLVVEAYFDAHPQRLYMRQACCPTPLSRIMPTNTEQSAISGETSAHITRGLTISVAGLRSI